MGLDFQSPLIHTAFELFKDTLKGCLIKCLTLAGQQRLFSHVIPETQFPSLIEHAITFDSYIEKKVTSHEKASLIIIFFIRSAAGEVSSL